jgi:hypothetical protein
MIPILTGFPFVKGMLLDYQIGVDMSDYTDGWIEVNGFNEVASNLSPNRTPSKFLGFDTSDYTIAQPLKEAISVWAPKKGERSTKSHDVSLNISCRFVDSLWVITSSVRR